MPSSLHYWLRVSFINLLIVAWIGVMLRYKIAFSFPFVDQKHLLHGHSHFAFSGWITQVLMVMLVQYLSQFKGEGVFKKYLPVLYANLITAYGMLVFFPIQGYGAGSISFSVLSIVNSYVFAVMYWRDLNRLRKPDISHYWYKASLVFYALSSIGAFSLAYMMANKIVHQNGYLAAVYYFLHFQYNGWFFFAGMGLLVSRIEKITATIKQLKLVFWSFFLACIPAYFLSVLWMSLPGIVYGLVVVAALMQCVGWVLMILLIRKNNIIIKAITGRGTWLLLLSAIALTIKLLLQLGSTHPALSQLAFGFRPIVIGYLHLVLLGMITVFIIGYLVSMQMLIINKMIRAGILIFVTGIFINELLLMLQGVAGLNYVIVPFINEMLLMAAAIMFIGILLISCAFRKTNALLPAS